ncbi:MAG TPA: biotin--[acetyl-CoA-carboxylase] ligase [Gemmatimonadaceae bacterium]
MADATYDGHSGEALREWLGLPAVEVWETVGSTLDVAHERGAAGAPAGTLILADRQSAGRGRAGHRWESAAGAGIWLTLLERPADAAGIDLLSIRLGLGAARALDRFAPDPVRVKWPNDLWVAAGKLAGILVESRWRDGRVDWVAIGLGLNTRPPAELPGGGGALAPGVSRVEVLAELLPALRAAAAGRDELTERELAAWHERDLARGRRVREPAAGEVLGIDARGALLVRTADGDVACRTGSLIFEEDT